MFRRQRWRALWRVAAPLSFALSLTSSIASAATETSSPSPSPDGLTLEFLLRETLANHPDFQSAQENVVLQAQVEPTVTAWAAPTVTATLAPATLVTPFFGGAPPGVSLQLGQRVPWPLRQEAKRQVARRQSDIAKRRVAAERLALLRQSSKAFHRYWVATQSVDVQRDVIALARQQERTAETAYQSGHGLQQDTLQAQVERIHAEHQLHVFERKVTTARAQLNRMMNRDVQAPLPPPVNVTPPPSSKHQLLHPFVNVAAAEVDAAKANEEVAFWRYVPDVQVQATYNSMWPMLSHQFMVGFSVALPVQFGAIEAMSTMAATKTKIAQHRKTSAERQVEEAIFVADARLEEATRVEQLLRTELLPVASERATATLVGYQNGESSFALALQAARHHADVRLQLIEAKGEIGQAQSESFFARGHFPSIDPPLVAKVSTGGAP